MFRTLKCCWCMTLTYSLSRYENILYILAMMLLWYCYVGILLQFRPPPVFTYTAAAYPEWLLLYTCCAACCIWRLWEQDDFCRTANDRCTSTSPPVIHCITQHCISQTGPNLAMWTSVPYGGAKHSPSSVIHMHHPAPLSSSSSWLIDWCRGHGWYGHYIVNLLLFLPALLCPSCYNKAPSCLLPIISTALGKGQTRQTFSLYAKNFQLLTSRVLCVVSENCMNVRFSCIKTKCMTSSSM